jgi:hypothetical protein
VPDVHGHRSHHGRRTFDADEGALLVVPRRIVMAGPLGRERIDQLKPAA